MAHARAYTGKLAVITGGASGLGLALAHALATRGAKPVLIDIAAAQTPYPLERADVSDAKALSASIARIKQDHGPIDLLIANAAIDLTGQAHDLAASDWRAIIDTNLIGATNLISAVYPDMVARRAGQIILIASGAGLIGFPVGAPYTASKAGLIGMGQALRAEAARHGVTVTVACPPILETPLLQTGQAKPGINRAAFIASLQKKPMPAEHAAKLILEGATGNTSPLIFPYKLRLAHIFATLFPAIGDQIRANILRKFDRFGHGRPPV